MTAASPMVILLLLVAIGVAVAFVSIASGRFGGGIALPPRPPRRSRRARRTTTGQDLR